MGELIGNLPQTPTADLLKNRFTCKEDPFETIDKNGSVKGRARQCSKQGDSASAEKPELAFSNKVSTIYRKTEGVRNEADATITWRGTVLLGGVAWNVTVTDDGGDGLGGGRDTFTVEGSVSVPTAGFTPAAYFLGRPVGADFTSDPCWRLAGDEIKSCAQDVFQPVNEAYNRALVRLGLKRTPSPK